MSVEYATEFCDWSSLRAPTRSGTDFEAMMISLPGHEPDAAVVSQLVLREAISDCLEQLSDEDRYVLEAIWFEGISYRALAARMGLHKSYTYRIAARAVARLGQLCEVHPTIVGHLS